jgi:SSS family solute:Na+ symporter
VLEVVVLSVFGLLLLLLAVYGYKVSAKTAEDYMLAGRGIGIVVMFFFALFSISSAWTFYGYPGFLYRHGPGLVYFIWGGLAGLVLLYMFLGPRIWAVSKLNRFLSPVEVVAERYESPVLRVILGIILLAAIVPYMADQSLGVGLGFEALTGKEGFRVVGMIYLSGLLVLVVLLGGMRMSAWVNVLLGTLYTVAFLGALIWVIFAAFPEGPGQIADLVPRENVTLLPGSRTPPTVTSILFFVGLLSLTWPHVTIGTMTAQDKSIFLWMPGLALVVAGIFFYTIPFIWGALVTPAISELPDTKVPRVTLEGEMARLRADVEAGKAGPMTGEEMERIAEKRVTAHSDKVVQKTVGAYLPAWAGVFVLVGVIGAALSTAAVQLMTSSIIISRDIIHGYFLPRARDATLLLVTKLAIIGVVLASFVIAWWYPVSLAEYLVNIATPGFAQWGPALVGGILWKRGTKYGAISGAVAGTGVLAVCFTLGLLPGKAILPALGVNVLLYVVVSLLTPKPSDEVVRKYFDEVEDFLSKKA